MTRCFIDPLLREGHARSGRVRACQSLGRLVRFEDGHASGQVALGLGVVLALVLDIGHDVRGLGDEVLVARPLSGRKRLLRVGHRSGDVALLVHQARQRDVHRGARGACVVESLQRQAAVVLRQCVAPAAEHLERLGEILACQCFVFDGADFFVDADTLLEVLRRHLEIAAAKLDDPHIVVCGDQVPQIALGLRKGEVHLVVLECGDPVAELPERVAEVRRRHFAEPFGSDLLADLQRLDEQLARPPPIAKVVLDDPEHVHHVAEDDVRLVRVEKLQRTLREDARRLGISLLPMKAGNSIQQLGNLER